MAIASSFAKTAETSNEDQTATDRTAEFQETMRQHFKAHVEGTNINEHTLLTTDYLNHFSSFLMLLELLPSDPEELGPDLLAWKPKTYIEHFEESGFRDKDMAVAAYAHVAPNIRSSFDNTIDNLHDLTATVLHSVKRAMETKHYDGINELALDAAPKIRQLIDDAAAIINGSAQGNETTSQAAIDNLFDG